MENTETHKLNLLAAFTLFGIVSAKVGDIVGAGGFRFQFPEAS